MGPVLGDGGRLVSHAAAGGVGVLVAGQDGGEAGLWSSHGGTQFRTVSVLDGAVRAEAQPSAIPSGGRQVETDVDLQEGMSADATASGPTCAASAAASTTAR